MRDMKDESLAAQSFMGQETFKSNDLSQRDPIKLLMH